MIEREVVIVPANGIHGRPAAKFVKEAKSFTSEVTIVKGEIEASAKSLLRIMTLDAKQGDTVVIRADGADEEAAVEALSNLLSTEES